MSLVKYLLFAYFKVLSPQASISCPLCYSYHRSTALPLPLKYICIIIIIKCTRAHLARLCKCEIVWEEGNCEQMWAEGTKSRPHLKKNSYTICRCGHALSKMGSSSSGSNGVSLERVGSGRKILAETCTHVTHSQKQETMNLIKWHTQNRGFASTRITQDSHHVDYFGHDRLHERLLGAVDIIHQLQQSLHACTKSRDTFSMFTKIRNRISRCRISSGSL
jgi:hypothetical protein